MLVEYSWFTNNQFYSSWNKQRRLESFKKPQYYKVKFLAPKSALPHLPISSNHKAQKDTMRYHFAPFYQARLPRFKHTLDKTQENLTSKYKNSKLQKPKSNISTSQSPEDSQSRKLRQAQFELK